MIIIKLLQCKAEFFCLIPLPKLHLVLVGLWVNNTVLFVLDALYQLQNIYSSDLPNFTSHVLMENCIPQSEKMPFFSSYASAKIRGFYKSVFNSPRTN